MRQLKTLMTVLVSFAISFLCVACSGGDTPLPTVKYTVTAPAGVGFLFARIDGTGNLVVKGDDFKFSITVLETHEGTPVVKANNVIILVNNGVYTIANVQADQTITVTGITQKQTPDPDPDPDPDPITDEYTKGIFVLDEIVVEENEFLNAVSLSSGCYIELDDNGDFSATFAMHHVGENEAIYYNSFESTYHIQEGLILLDSPLSAEFADLGDFSFKFSIDNSKCDNVYKKAIL